MQASNQLGYSILPFTQGFNGTYLPNAAQGWAYTLYNYADSTHKHAVTSLSSGEAYSYDANGNMTQRVEGGVTYTQNFDIENRLASVTVGGQTTTFVYDGDGNLVKKLKPDGTSTVYIGGLYEVDLDSGGAATKKTSYYPAGGAMRVEIVGASNTLYYMLRDHLGSASVTLDASGAIVANGEQRYYPFGESRIAGASLPTDRLYTGQRFIDGTGGLYHYGARFYLSKLGRFISADSIVPQPFNPQSLNRFSYALNNPLKYNDPTGHTSACAGPARASAEDCADYKPTPRPQQGSGGMTSQFMRGDDLLPKTKCCITPVVPNDGRTCIDCNGWPQPEGRTCIDCEGWPQPEGPQVICYGIGTCGWGVPDFGSFGSGIFMPPGYDRCKDGPLMWSANGCDGPEIIASTTLAPGPYAGDSIPARGPGRDWTEEERRRIDEIGKATGCHTCGTTDPGTKAGHFVPDHQPVTALNTDGSPQRLFPQCLACSLQQAKDTVQELKRRRHEGNAG